jgi:hypothetical protein
MIVPMDARDELRTMISGFRVSMALSVAADLGLSDRLAAGPRTVAELATAVDADEDTLRRLLHALSTVGVYAEQPDGSFGNTPLGEGLRSDVPGSMRPMARTLSDPSMWSAWGHLGHSVRTGENAFQELHGVDVWTHRSGEPEQNAIFNDYMTAVRSVVAAPVAAGYDFSAFSTVVDVGGGQGALLEAVLDRHPHLTGTVFDQPHVVRDGHATTGDLGSRWSVASGSFFEEVPAADVYLLKAVLHDWPDDECRSILETCRRTLAPGGVVLVVERVLGAPGREAETAFSDLNMLVLPGGRERSEAEFAALFDAAGLRLTRVVDTGTPFSLVEGVANRRERPAPD